MSSCCSCRCWQLLGPVWSASPPSGELRLWVAMEEHHLFITSPFPPLSLSSSPPSLPPSLQVWSCHQCYCLFHLQCIQQWARDGVKQTSLLSPELFPGQEVFWSCPKCRLDYPSSQFPNTYFCFCQKQVTYTSTGVLKITRHATTDGNPQFPSRTKLVSGGIPLVSECIGTGHPWDKKECPH